MIPITKWAVTDKPVKCGSGRPFHDVTIPPQTAALHCYDGNKSYWWSCSDCVTHYKSKGTWSSIPAEPPAELKAMCKECGWKWAVATEEMDCSYNNTHKIVVGEWYIDRKDDGDSLPLCRREECSVGMGKPPDPDAMKVKLISFSYRNGKPEGVNAVMDVRKSVRNPWRNPKLRKLNGLHKDVQEFVGRCRGGKDALNSIMNSFTVIGRKSAAIGCAGGKHRSVAVVELAAAELRKSGYDVTVEHRDLKVKSKEA